MRQTLTVDTAGPAAVPLRWWRVTTAVRVFTLALASGLMLSTASLGAAGAVLAALVLIASACCALEWGTLGRSTRWLPLGEMVLVALILTIATPQPWLFAYLAVPPVIAGVRHGLITTINSAVIGFAVIAAASMLPGMQDFDRLVTATPWLVIGLGAGLLTNWQSRAARDIGDRMAPYAAAHQLMTQLHALARRGALGLDSTELSTELETRLREVTGATRSAVFAHAERGGLNLISSFGDATGLEEQVWLSPGNRLVGVGVVPLRGVEELLGVVVLQPVHRWDEHVREQASAIADQFALRLDTAVLFDAVRHMATSDERNRIAREMHDGVAQEIVALGYVVDEIESTATDPETRSLAGSLRDEITRVVTELRYSIFDLRHEVADNGLPGSLAQYAREVSADTDIRVHLVLDDVGPQVSTRVQGELLRIAQEAIGNVRRHAKASNLWVTFVSDGSRVRLQVDDDGIGNAEAKERHWGLQTMRERAQGIGADLIVAPRQGGGTTVRLISRHATSPEGSSTGEHLSPVD